MNYTDMINQLGEMTAQNKLTWKRANSTCWKTVFEGADHYDYEVEIDEHDNNIHITRGVLHKEFVRVFLHFEIAVDLGATLTDEKRYNRSSCYEYRVDGAQRTILRGRNMDSMQRHAAEVLIAYIKRWYTEWTMIQAGANNWKML